MKNKGFSAQILGPARRLRNRYWIWRAGRSSATAPSGALPETLFTGEADRGARLVAGFWPVAGREIDLRGGSIWSAALPEPRLASQRASFDWLDDLAALGNRSSRLVAQNWLQDWISRHGAGAGPGWRPELAGRRATAWVAHSRLLTDGLDAGPRSAFWGALARHQGYLARAWLEAPPGIPQLHALGGLVWTGRVLPHDGHPTAVARLGEIAETMVGPEGELESRRPEDLAKILALLVWTARILEDGGESAAPSHLAAIVRIVPALRQLRTGSGFLPRFHGGGSADATAIDKALAELRLEALPKARAPMGYTRLTGGRVVVILDGAGPPAGAAAMGAHASALAFEMSVGRQLVVGNQGPGGRFGDDWAQKARLTPAHCAVDVDGLSSAEFRGGALVAGPTLVTVRQAQDATGMWLLGTHDGFVSRCGLLHERRVFVGARGTEVRGEEILTVTDARARSVFDRAARAAGGRLSFSTRFHLHPDVVADYCPERQTVLLTLAGGEAWEFRAAGGALLLEPSLFFDAQAPAPQPTRQMVVHAEVVDYLGQVTWSFGRIVEAPRAGSAPRLP